MVEKVQNPLPNSYMENEYVELWEEEGIIYEKFKPQTVLNMEAGRKVVEDRMKLSNKRVMPLLVDIKNLVSVDVQTRRWMATEEALAYLSAGAFIINNTLTRLFFNTFLKLDKPKIPTRGFPNESKALIWLEHYKRVN